LAKIGPTSQLLLFFHSTSMRIDEKIYNDPFRILFYVKASKYALDT
jgi:hypothetical protein